MNKTIKRVLLSIVIIVLLTPIFIEYLILRNEIVSYASNSEWMGFIASFYGGALGGIATLLAVLFSLRQTTMIQKKIDDRHESQRLVNLMPIFTFIEDHSESKWTRIFSLPDDGKCGLDANIRMKNIGEGISHDMYCRLSLITENPLKPVKNFVGKSEEISIRINDRVPLRESIISPLLLVMYFKDLDNNLYVQEGSFSIDIDKHLVEAIHQGIPRIIEKAYTEPTFVYIESL